MLVRAYFNTQRGKDDALGHNDLSRHTPVLASGMGQWGSLITALIGDATGPLLGPRFEPPYDSPIEEIFAWNVVKYTAVEVELMPQFDIETRRGRFRLDFLLRRGPYRVAIECDGREFHDAWRDEWRDAITLGEGHADVIYRLRGHDIHFNMAECLFLLAHWEPNLFTAAGRMNLSSLVYSKTLSSFVTAPRCRVREFVCDEDGHTHGQGRDCRQIDLERRIKDDRVMRRHYERSQAVGDGDLDTAIALASVLRVERTR